MTLPMPADCWYCDVRALSDPALFSRGMSMLPWEERRERVTRFRFEKDRRLCLGAGLLLAHALRRAGVSDLSLRLLSNGKPVLSACPDVRFNLSHSGTLAVCAVSDHPLGVDAEVLQGVHPEVSALCFQKAEQEWIDQAADPGRAFTRLWTRKESYLKMLGTGLNSPLNSFSVLPGEPAPEGCAFTEQEIGEHLICVCAHPDKKVVFREWQWA